MGKKCNPCSVEKMFEQATVKLASGMWDGDCVRCDRDGARGAAIRAVDSRDKMT